MQKIDSRASSRISVNIPNTKKLNPVPSTKTINNDLFVPDSEKDANFIS